ncbi:SslE/AcfD family lipoprotein zinc metalloprotease [Vibrio sp. HDW18]|uniref:SslE/AcfD family lipoprotein zinc metalloprotease n=1 Tax=Vibrio sp. HDW18 TaxID=2714948 RepID=UPI00140B7900|nr:SslE/AcfD family lipoprotein zinc metalloprotease [Vibrio sp. HDW18]QIL86439.1 SslE/AcfD family lipoprotein zinc metalloprotease [Vibrio sp. HDW18]
MINTKLKLISAMVMLALSGCNHDSMPIDPPSVGGGELPDIGVDDPIIAAQLSLDGNLIFGGSVLCNDAPANQFTVPQKGNVICTVEGLTLATFIAPFVGEESQSTNVNQRSSSFELMKLIDADEYKDSAVRQSNLQILINNMGNVQGKTIELNFTSSRDALTFENYLNHLDMPSAEFRELIVEKVSNDNQVDKQPSTHVPDITPALTTGSSNDLNSSFVSANAEESLQYQPTSVILSQGRLLDSDGRAVNGIAYFSNNSRGVTGVSQSGRAMGDGGFEFSWGDSISFAIDTFELGTLRGNKTTFQLTDLGSENAGKNAQALVLRYAEQTEDTVSISDKVTQVFAQYPNVVNEAISLSLSNEDVELKIGAEQTQIVLGEFAQQFSQGIAAEIDQALQPTSLYQTRSQATPRSAVDQEASRIQADIEKLWGSTSTAWQDGWKKVERFHVFHDSTNFYGSTGSARAQAAVNIANSAFPVLMARNDNNYWIDFGKPKAWDAQGLAFITEAPSQVEPEKVSAETATFNLPFISLGELGQGKVMVLGNARYNSILVCPNGFSWGGSVDQQGNCTAGSDSDDMANFFTNVLRYLTQNASSEAGTGSQMTIGTNIPSVYFKRAGQVMGSSAPFVLDSRFAAETVQLTDFSHLDPVTIPVVIINAYEYRGHTAMGAYDLPLSADLSRPKLSQQDVSDLIDYVTWGGNVLMMETVVNRTSLGEIDRLLDSAGIAFGMGSSVVADGNGPSGGYPDRVRNQRQHGIWVLERYAAVNGDGGPMLPYTINEDGSVEWYFILHNKPSDKPSLEMATWTQVDDEGNASRQVAFIDEADHLQKDADGVEVLNQASLATAKQRILNAFPTSTGLAYQECRDDQFNYEVNCLEYRPGNGIPVTGSMYRPRYTELKLGNDEAQAMIKAANLGTNIEALYQHERYFRTKGKQGERLSSVDLNRIYQNMTVWLWNDLDYRYESTYDDELGFKRFTEFLNCYTRNLAGGNTVCPEDLQLQLTEMQMVYGAEEGEYAGQMNPSYPLNYMEKPLTRLMLGRSFWDLDVNVDVRQFPGEAKGANGKTVQLDMRNQTSAWFAGNRQPTGQWAVAQQPFQVSVTGESQPVTITIALADDLTGREKHELGLQRPPRMTKSFVIGGGQNSSQSFTVPYGGLIYAQGGNSEQVSLTFAGTIDAPLYQGEEWINGLDAPAPIGEVVSDSFIFTAPKANLQANGYEGGIAQFAQDLDQFALDLSDFYARDEGIEGKLNRQATSASNPNNRHHFVNDIAISIGAAHSGYPVMNASFNAASNKLNTNPLNSWLLWHEIGHNAAEAPFNVEGATEVVNNLLALYMQDRHLGKMARVEQDIQIAPQFVRLEQGHAWAAGGAGERLVMFAQLKEWAESEFQIADWYPGELPSYYSAQDGVKGWNLFKLMHRLTRNAQDDAISLKGDNLCQLSGLGKSDQLMLCASYATQTDLSEFFQAWNPGSRAFVYPGDPHPYYEGGVSDAGVKRVQALSYPKPQRDPLKVDRISMH